MDKNQWLDPQPWERDVDAPGLSLGAAGQFDDTHLFAPCVALENERYYMWYSGSRGEVDLRVFALGLATSDDGLHFTRHPASPVCTLADGSHSILTPTLVRHPDGSLRREAGKLRMFFSSTDFPSGDKRHTLHAMTSDDGLRWEAPSEPLLENAYAPTLFWEDDRYRLWYTDVSADPWTIRAAHSDDGFGWQIHPQPVLELDQEWEFHRLVYPTVLKEDGYYLMWYGSYSSYPPEVMKTSIGFAVSEDGLNWTKSPHNPIFGPDPSRPWESHFTTSHSLLRLADGSLRLWYASRTKPPFVHKYYAIGTARWPA